MRALFIASVANLKPARLLALDDDLAVLQALIEICVGEEDSGLRPCKNCLEELFAARGVGQ